MCPEEAIHENYADKMWSRGTREYYANEISNWKLQESGTWQLPPIVLVGMLHACVNSGFNVHSLVGMALAVFCLWMWRVGMPLMFACL